MFVPRATCYVCGMCVVVCEICSSVVFLLHPVWAQNKKTYTITKLPFYLPNSGTLLTRTRCEGSYFCCPRGVATAAAVAALCIKSKKKRTTPFSTNDGKNSTTWERTLRRSSTPGREVRELPRPKRTTEGEICFRKERGHLPRQRSLPSDLNQ